MNQLLVRVFILLASVAVFSTEVTVENGGFNDVLVYFSQNVPSGKGQALLENLRTQLANASEILQNSIGLRINQVTFVIPTSWDTSDWNITVEPSTENPGSLKADIVVDNTEDNVFGTFPFAQQYGSCGIPGHQLIIPSHFLTDENKYPKATALAREWLKFRYGVFDENGYPGDEQYPLYYAIPGSDPSDVKFTDCTNEPVTYTFLDGDEKNCSTTNNKTGLPEGCIIVPEKESLENVTSSLMYFQENIHNMQDVCGRKEEHPHSSGSPNKHNALCREQSVWDIIKTSIDFSVQFDIEESANITFTYVQESSPKVVFAWQNTGSLHNEGQAILKVIKKVIYDLTKGSKYATFPYTDATSTEEIKITLKELNNWPDDWKTDIESSFVMKGDGCISCAISKALNVLSPDTAAGATGTAIIIASGTNTSPGMDDNLLERIKSSKICLLLFVVSDGDVPQEYRDYASASFCGHVTEFSRKDSEVELFEKLFHAMEPVLPETVDDKVTTTLKTELLQIQENTSLSFDVDDTVEKITFWTFPPTDPGALKFKFNESPIEVAKEIIITGLTALSYSPTQAGKIDLIVDVGSNVKQTSLMQVRITSKAGQYLHGQIFILDTTPKESTIQMPVVIYASIWYGAYPVQNANVTATISRPNAEKIEMLMFDDGRGDPDITANDGVYSRYFTEFNDAGEYTVEVTVEIGEHTSGGKLNQASDHSSCCGSKLQSGNLQLPHFTRTFEATFKALSGKPKEGYKPSRIVDLKIDSVSDDKVVLKWTAPGAEADNGTASNYEMKLFCEKEENTTDCDLHKWVRVLNKPLPMNYGTKQQVTMQVLNNSQILSVGIISINENNQESDLSNIIQLIRTNFELEITTSNPDSSNDGAQRSPPVGTIAGLIAAGIVILISLAGAILYLSKRKSKQEESIESNGNIEPEKNSINASNTSNYRQPMRRVESFPVLLYTHNQIKDFKDNDKDPPLFKGDVPPKPWMSLNALSNPKSGENFDSDNKSLGSSSTMHVNGASESKETGQMVEVPLR